MCVIMEIPPDTVLDEDKFDNACTRNSDGYGILYVDRGKLSVFKKYNEAGNKTDEILSKLHEGKDLTRYVHLRLRTHGEKNEDNCHPFRIFKDGQKEIYFMHNGIISSLGSNKYSDSYHFCQDILSPLLVRSAKYLEDQESYLQDPLMHSILNQYAGLSSKFVLVDWKGFCLKINEDSGKEITFYPERKDVKSTIWASNEYSFQNYGGGRNSSNNFQQTNYPIQRPYVPQIPFTPSNTPEQKGQKSGTETWVTEWRQASGEIKPDRSVLPPQNNFTRHIGGLDAHKHAETNAIREEMVEKMETANPNIVQVPRASFIEVFGISSWEEITKLTSEDFKELIEEMPEAMVTLLCDLRDMLFHRVKATSAPITLTDETDGEV